MADRLVVNLDLVRGSAEQLESLVGEFRAAGSIADDAGADVGEPQLRDALHDFADNWRTHREHLLESMESVHKMAVTAVDTYTQADHKLSHALQRAEHRTDARIPSAS